MKNNMEWLLEDNKDKVLEVVLGGDTLAITKKDNKIMPCFKMICADCLFFTEDKENCRDVRNKWLYEEHVEVPKEIKLTKKEKMFLDLLSTDYKYMARDEDDALYAYEGKPYKDIYNAWQDNGNDELKLSYFNINSAFGNLFEFVKWEDESPVSLDWLRTLSVKEDD